MCDVLGWFLAIRDDPYRVGTAAVPVSMLHTCVAPLPSYRAACRFYAVDDEAQIITALLLETT
jgi:hypothetical protein